MVGLKKWQLLFVLFTSLVTRGIGQGEANVWYFGNKAGVDFNSGSPVVLYNGQMNTTEGCATISDAAGNLRFYTDGISVWNANHAVMSNGTGLLGHSSATQSAIIIPKPGSPDVYYIVTVPANGSNPVSSLNYSEVDMTLQSGLGDVTLNKNIFMMAPASEKVTAVSHSNGSSIWVIVQKHFSDSLYAFLVTSSGINLTPVKSWGGASVTGFYGYMKVSPQGDKLARTNGTIVELFDFNNSTGVCTYQTSLTPGGTCYGLEYSLSGKRLYINRYNLGLVQANLDAGTAAQIQASITFIGSSTPATGQALQMAPDGKIYCTGFSSYLSVINEPDSLGAACLYVPNVVNLTPNSGRWGLPTFIQSFFFTETAVTDTCENDTTKFALVQSGLTVDSVHWNFDDTASGLLNFGTGANTTHVFSSPGLYQVIATIFSTHVSGGLTINDTIYDTLMVNIHPLPVIDLGSDTVLCQGDSISLVNNNTTLNMTYLWSIGSTNPNIPVFVADTYSVEVTTLCGVAYDTIIIDSVLPAFAELGLDTVACSGDTVDLEVEVAFGNYLWQDGYTGNVYHATQTGFYSVTTTGLCNADSDTVHITFVTLAQTGFPDDTTFCNGSTAQFKVHGDSTTYSWSNGSADSILNVSIAGTFMVTATNVCGTMSDTVLTIIDYPQMVDLGADTVLCVGFDYTLDATQPGENDYLWQNGATTETILVKEEGSYWVEVTNTCGSYSDTLEVYYDEPPRINLPEDTLLCTGNVVPLAVAFSRSTYKWNTGSTDSLINVTVEGDYSVTATNICGVDSAAIRVDFDFPLDFQLGDVLLGCEGTPFVLGVEAPNSPKYYWNTGHKEPYVDAFTSGKYILTITNTCGAYTDEVLVEMDPIPNIGFPNDTVLCGKAQLRLEPVTTFSNYMWHDTTVSRSYLVSEPGTYWLQATTRCGTDRDTIVVRYSDGPMVDLGPDTFICQEFSIIELVVDDTNARIYDWNTHDVSDRITVYEPGTYAVTVSDQWKCNRSDEVLVGECPVRLFIPSSFSPNDDGVNDVFRVEGEFLSEFHLMIFNRWGELVFQTHDMSQGWNGKIKDRPAPNYSYTYRLRYKPNGGLTEERFGSVVLIR